MFSVVKAIGRKTLEAIAGRYGYALISMRQDGCETSRSGARGACGHLTAPDHRAQTLVDIRQDSGIRYPSISLVTPNYNFAEFLGATIRSVADQHYPKLEYVVMDDGSTDDSIAVIKEHETLLSHWETGPNCGQYEVITRGFANTSGEIMGWLNSDDMHMPWTLRAVGQIFAAFPDVAWISSLQPGVWDCEGICVKVGHHKGFSKQSFLDGFHCPSSPIPGQWTPPSGWYIQQESTFWRRSLWEETGGYLSSAYASAGDFDLWSRFFDHADLIGVDLPLAGFRKQYRQQTSDIVKYRKHASRILREARSRNQWEGPAKDRGIAGLFRAHRKQTMYKRGKYAARRVVRQNPAGPEPMWTLESYEFP